MKDIIIILTFLTSFVVCAQTENKVLFHKIEYTASSVKLIKFEIEPVKGQAYVKETIDSLNRTIKLEFYNWSGELDWAGSGFYGGPIIKYDYNENTIIETFFSGDSEIANDFRWSEAPYRFIYYLDKKKNLVSVKSYYKIDFQFNKESLESIIQHLQFYKKYANETEAETMDVDHVFGYTYAKAKLNGKHPKYKE